MRRQHDHGALNPLVDDEGEPFAPGTPAFMRACNAAIEAPRIARTAGTLQAVIDAYEKSPQFTKLAPRTQRDYGAPLVKIGDIFGTHPLVVVEDL